MKPDRESCYGSRLPANNPRIPPKPIFHVLLQVATTSLSASDCRGYVARNTAAPNDVTVRATTTQKMLEADRNIQFCLFFGRLLLRLAGHLTGSGGRCGLVVFGVMGLRAADHNLALADFDATGPEGMPYRFPNDGPEHPRRGQHNAQTNDT